MALTLRSSTFFINLKDSMSIKAQEDFPKTITFPRFQARCLRRAIRSSRDEPRVRTGRGIGEEMRTKVGWEKLHSISVPHGSDSKVPVYIMLPLDTVTLGGNFNKPRAMNASLMALKSAGVEGVMVDAWWGLVEKGGPMKYNWEGYAELVKMVAKHGLKLQVVMSFHQCEGNAGDSCSIPLPPWVLEEISKNPDLVYTDRSGRRNLKYITLGCDLLPVLRGRTPIQVYTDYMKSFRDRFRDYMGNVIAEIQVGMGPCGELRYPSYPESNGTWRFPRIGEFQCYDKYMRASLKALALGMGNSEWGSSEPHDSGLYNQYREETGFFRREGTWTTEYGQFLEWYSQMLIQHGDRILAAAKGVFEGTQAKLSGKVAEIHWHYSTRSHAAELTAGYYNTIHIDGYLPIAQMMGKHEVVLNFTCMEMQDEQQQDNANCSLKGLVRQVKMAAKAAEVELAGEIALERYDESAYTQVLATSRSDAGLGLSDFTYLRMNRKLFEENDWRNLVEFVKSMSEGGRSTKLSDSDLGRTNLYVGFVKEISGQKAKEAVLVKKMSLYIDIRLCTMET